MIRGNGHGTPPYDVILGRLQQGKAIPFLGAGASFAGRASGAEWEQGAFQRPVW